MQLDFYSKGDKLKMGYTYKRNIELINLLYRSELCDRICTESNEKINFTVLKPIINSFYQDPDSADENLYENKYNKLVQYFISKNKILDNKIAFGLDGLCGWKILFDIHDGKESWLKDYEIIRGSQFGYLIWPNNTNNRKHPTINQLRYREFGDRIDYTLYDIDLFLKEEIDKCRLKEAYHGQTAIFLKKFKTIVEFSEATGLQALLNRDGKVKNLAVKNSSGEYGIIIDEQHEKYKFNSRWGTTKKIESLSSYIENIMEICKANKLTNFNL